MQNKPTEEEAEDITGEIYNLAMVLSTLGELDPMLMSSDQQDKLSEMKDRVFDALVKRCDGL